MNRNWFTRALQALQAACADVRYDVLQLAAHYAPKTYLWLHARLAPGDFVETCEIDGKTYEVHGYGAGKKRRYELRELPSAEVLGAEAWTHNPHLAKVDGEDEASDTREQALAA